MSVFERQTQAFLSWLSAVPGVYIHPDIAVSDLRSRGAGRGVVATTSIAADTDLFSIPRTAVISTETSDLLSRLPQVLQDVEDPWLKLIFILIYEHGRGQESRWKAYFDILPDTFDTLMFWSDGELDQLQASDVRSKIGRDSANALFLEKIVPALQANAAVFNVAADTSTDELLRLAHRMGSTIMAYAFDLEKDDDPSPDDDGYATEDEEYALLTKGMVPLADMLNADAEFNAHLFHGPTALTMKSLRDIGPGEEILNDYGPLPRADLLRRYGYVTPKYARYDVVELPQSQLVSLCQAMSGLSRDELVAKVDSATAGEIDLDDDTETFLMERESDDTDDSGLNASVPKLSLPEDAVLLTKILLARPEEASRLKKLDPARRAELEQQTGKVLEELLRHKLQAYATTIAQDEQLLADTANTHGRLRLAVEVRLGEKKLLQEGLRLAQGLQQTSNGHSEDGAPASKRQRTG